MTQKDGPKELESRYNDKIKQGYTYLNELCDMQGLPPVEDGDNDALFNFLNTYLPKDLSNGNSNLLLPTTIFLTWYSTKYYYFFTHTYPN